MQSVCRADGAGAHELQSCLLSLAAEERLSQEQGLAAVEWAVQASQQLHEQCAAWRAAAAEYAAADGQAAEAEQVSELRGCMLKPALACCLTLSPQQDLQTVQQQSLRVRGERAVAALQLLELRALVATYDPGTLAACRAQADRQADQLHQLQGQVQQVRSHEPVDVCTLLAEHLCLQLRAEVEEREGHGEEYLRLAVSYKDDLQMIADLTAELGRG